MGRTRIAVAVLAGLVGVTAIFLGVRISTRDSNSTLATEGASIPEVTEPTPSDDGDDAVTGTTFDLGVLAPTSTSAAPASTTTPTTAPKPTTTTVPKGYAVVHLTNSSAYATKVFLGDDSEHEAVLRPGDTANWKVRIATTHPDAGGARINGTNCGALWSDVDYILSGHEYHFEVKPSTGVCGNGAAMPMVVLTDYTAGSSKTVKGLMADATHSLIYVHNLLDEAGWFRITDDAGLLNWMLPSGAWGEGKLVSANGDKNDFQAGRMSTCKFGGGIGAALPAGRTFVLELSKGAHCDPDPNDPLNIPPSGDGIKLVFRELPSNEIVLQIG